MTPNKSRVFLGIGSNLGKRASNINKALALLNDAPQITVIQMSRIFETEPVGNPDQNKFFNAVIEIRTEFSPQELLEYLHKIESRMGRVRTQLRNQPRTIDLDILLFDDLIVKTSDLTIPHPLMAERWFVLKPFADIAPDVAHPETKLTVKQLLNNLSLGHSL